MVGMNYRKEDVAPVNHFYHGQISVVIPIIDYGQHNVEAAKAAERRTKATNQMEKDQLTSEIYHLYSQHEASKKAIDVFKLKNLRSIESKFADAETAFRKGYIDALTFLQIDSQVHENIDQIYLSRLSYLSTLSNLSLLSGRQPEI
jgi:outer membrane protein TolC